MIKPRLHHWFMLVLAVLCALLAVRAVRTSGAASLASAPDIPWSTPTTIATKNTGASTASADERTYPCTTLTYRMAYDLSKIMYSGCFVPTAFGLYEPSKDIVIFDGTDEAMPLRHNGEPAALIPLPYTNEMAQFSGFPQGVGTYMHLFTSLPSSLTKATNGLTEYENFTKAPDITVTAPTGAPLIVNTSAMAFAARGQWMVTESPAHALVRVNMTTFDALPFDTSFDNVGSPYKTHTASMAVTEDGRYAAVASNEYRTFKVYDLRTCVPTANSSPLTAQNCQLHNYWPTLQAIAGSAATISRVAFVWDGLITFDAHTASGTETFLLSPTGTISALIPYLGLGDSYASGQGAFDYLAGTDTGVNQCHLAIRSYPLRLSGDAFSGQGHSVACSGARIHDIGDESAGYMGQAADQRRSDAHEADGSAATILQNFAPGYLAQQQFVIRYQPGVITVQIGGNDIGFADILMRCVSPIAKSKLAANPNTCYQSYEDRLEVLQTIDRTYGKWVDLYRQLQGESPASQIYAIGYPQILASGGKCGLNVHLNAAEINFARGLTTYLNGVIRQAAAAAGVDYIDISDALAGHELCSGASGKAAMNGITAGNDALGMLGQESFHPTAYGHELIEQVILGATHNFSSNSKPTPAPTTMPPSASATDPLLRVPKSGRAIARLQPATITSAPVVQGGSLAITLKAEDANLRPSTSYAVKVGQTTLGAIQTDNQGNLQTTVSIPGNVEPGPQPIAVTGTDQAGDTETVEQTVYVDASDTDYDGDGTTNQQDSCPLVANTGADADHDGIDDACDGDASTPPDHPSGSDSSSSQQRPGRSDTSSLTPNRPISEIQNSRAIFSTPSITFKPSQVMASPKVAVSHPLSHAILTVGHMQNAALNVAAAHHQAILGAAARTASNRTLKPLPHYAWRWAFLAIMIMWAATIVLRDKNKKPTSKRTSG